MPDSIFLYALAMPTMRYSKFIRAPRRRIAQAVCLPDLVAEPERGLQGVVVQMLKIHDRQAIVARAGIDFRRRFAHGLGVREDTALNAQQILDGFQVGLPPCLVAFIAQRRRKQDSDQPPRSRIKLHNPYP